MVDKIGSLSQVLLRLQQAAASAKSARSSPAVKKQGGSLSAPFAEMPTLRDRVLQRLAAVEDDDPKRRQRAFRAFIEIRLLDTFGDQLSNDAGFQQLIDDVCEQMQADETLRTEIDEAVELLLAKN